MSNIEMSNTETDNTERNHPPMGKSRVDFKTLYCFELRKIVKRKILWITMGIMLVLLVFTVGSSLFGEYYVDGVKTDTHYHMFQVDRAYQKKLDGRLIDQTLLEEMKAGYGRIPSGVDRYTLTEEYQTYARPYSAIFHFARQIMGNVTVSEMLQMQWSTDLEEVHEKYRMMLEEEYSKVFLTQKEKDFWTEQQERLEWPLRFWYKEGYWQLFHCLQTIGLMAIFTIVVCLSNLFTVEHSRKTDQLILSSRYGKQTVYWAKFLAGFSVSFLVPLLYAVAAFIVAFAVYGSGGFSAAFQLIQAEYSYPLSVGEAVLIAYAMMLAAGMITGIFTMVLSEMLHSSIGTLSVIMGIVALTIFVTIPDQYRILARVWSCIPSEFVTMWNIFSLRTFPIFGKTLTAWQGVPVLYVILGGIFALIGKEAFTRYQVRGR